MNIDLGYLKLGKAGESLRAAVNIATIVNMYAAIMDLLSMKVLPLY